MSTPQRRSASGRPAAKGQANAAASGTPVAHERQDHMMRSLLELNRDLTVSLDLFDTTDLLLLNLMGQVGTARSALWLTSEQEAVLAIVRCHGFTRKLVDGALSAYRQRLHARLAQHPTPYRAWIHANDLDEADYALIHHAGIALLAPLVSRGELIGWIALGARVDRSAYDGPTLVVLETALGMIAMALENTRMFNRMCETNRRLTGVNEHLKEIDRLKSEFMNNVNHELRTPLSVVVGTIECVLETGTLEPPIRRLLETAQESSQNLRAIIENLLLWSEAARDSLVVALEDGDVRSMLEVAFRSRLPGITEDLRELRLEVPESPMWARFDSSRLMQIIQELLDNAVKFTPRGTLLHLRGLIENDAQGAWVRIDVEDNGPGIPADRLPSLFRSFEQVDGSMTRTVGGLGLGLAFAHLLAERMGGSLEATSKVGTGTRFTLRLPFAEPSALAEPAPPRRAAA